MHHRRRAACSPATHSEIALPFSSWTCRSTFVRSLRRSCHICCHSYDWHHRRRWRMLLSSSSHSTDMRREGQGMRRHPRRTTAHSDDSGALRISFAQGHMIGSYCLKSHHWPSASCRNNGLTYRRTQSGGLWVVTPSACRAACLVISLFAWCLCVTL